MLHNRIKQLRLARGLTLDGLAERMGGVVTKQALSKYERETSQPSLSVLTKLAEALGVKTAYLYNEPAVKVELLAYRKHATLLKRDRESIESFVSQGVEERIRLQELSGEPVNLNLPYKKINIRTLEDAEGAAESLRNSWKLGQAPIANVVGLLEDQFIHVFEIDFPDNKFDGISAVAYDEEEQLKAAAVVSRKRLPGERQRLNLAHEVGHLVMNVSENIDEEKAAFRFAGAFLAPANLLIREVGAHRSSIQFKELLILKKRFGISMQALLFRLRDLGIINEATFKWSCIQINRLGWKKQEPEELRSEEPQWMKQNVLRAVSEGLMTRDEAKRLTGESIEEDSQQFIDRRAFMKLPIAERHRILQEQSERLKDLYEHNPEVQNLGGGDILEH